jgi:transcriptional antiterminator RfaH
MNETPSAKKWFALYTKPRQEFKAASQLGAADIQYYLPTITRVSQWTDRKKQISEPVLKGYIFILASEGERLLALEQQSVVRCIFDRGKPAVIPDWQIENLKQFLINDAEFIINEGLIPGTKVLITDGPFQGIIGVIQNSENGHAIAVSIELLNRSIVAHLPKDSKYKVVKEPVR